jgi:hypothetical protein
MHASICGGAIVNQFQVAENRADKPSGLHSRRRLELVSAVWLVMIEQGVPLGDK